MPQEEFSLAFHVVWSWREHVSVIVETFELVAEEDLVAVFGSWDNETAFSIWLAEFQHSV